MRDTKTRPGKAAETQMAAALVSEDASRFEVRWDRTLLKRAADESSPAKGVHKRDGLNNLIAGWSAGKMSAAL